ncbi:MAG: MFS transporter [Steroidobacteraceae bacterium]
MESRPANAEVSMTAGGGDPALESSNIVRAEFRHGWPVLLAAALGNGAGLAAVPLYSLSSFIPPLQAQFGWSRGAIGAAATIITAGIFITGPLVGRLCDRYGVRRLALPSMVLLALALAALTQLSSSVATLYVGFVFVAIAGAATTSIVFTRVINTWFDRSRGLALGITMTGSGITAFAMPLLLGAVIPNWGWKAGFLLCAAVALLPLPVAWFLLHERRTTAAREQRSAVGMPSAVALRSRHFWTMVVAALVFSCAMGGIIVHVVPLLRDIGFSAERAARTASLLGVGIVAGRLLTGALLDRLHGPWVAASLMSTTAIGLAFLYSGAPSVAPLAVLIVGLALGSEGDLLAYFTARYFGMRSYAEIFGWLFGFLALGTATGPLMIMALQGAAGYRNALLTFIVFCLVAAVLLGSLGRYPDWSTPVDRTSKF